MGEKLLPWLPDDFDPDPIAEEDFAPFSVLRGRMSPARRRRHEAFLKRKADAQEAVS